jgi:hypothetical protein
MNSKRVVIRDRRICHPPLIHDLPVRRSGALAPIPSHQTPSPIPMKSQSLLLVLAIFAVCSLSSPTFAASHKPANGSPARVYSAQETSGFETLAKETIVALDAGDRNVMVAKLTDLETAWDAKEKVLKPKDASTWALLDKTLDRAISALRGTKVDLAAGKTALEDLLRMLESATKQ